MVSVVGKIQLDVVFSGHEDSATHTTSVEVVVTLLKTTGDVGEMLSSSLKRTNGEYLLKVAQNVRFLARQGIPLHFTLVKLIMVIPVTNAVSEQGAYAVTPVNYDTTSL